MFYVWAALVSFVLIILCIIRKEAITTSDLDYARYLKEHPPDIRIVHVGDDLSVRNH